MKAYKAATILLVEDDKADQKMIKESFNICKVANEIYITEDGEEALAYLQKSNAGDTECPWPDLILLDLNMPGMNGQEFLKRVKAEPAYETIPVVVLTTSDSEEDIEESYRKQASGYIKKPLSIPELQQSISELTDYWFILCKRIHPVTESQAARMSCY